MNDTLFTIFIGLALAIIIAILLIKIKRLNKKLCYVDEANTWHKLAITDDLTGVYNRTAYSLHINNEERKKETEFIILLDVDNFKTINDTKGHLEGDCVLKCVAKLLLENFPQPDYRVFRIGGDEFLVLSEGISERRIIEKLVSLRKRLKKAGEIRLSNGYCVVNGDYEEAFSRADEMLYVDKLTKSLRGQTA